MKECIACGTKNNGNNRFCSKCGTNFNGIVCPACNQEIDKNNSFCYLCGTDLTDYMSQIREIDRQNQLIDTDPELVIQNRGYIRLGIARLIFGVLAAISFSLFYGCLEWGWTDGIGIFGMSMFIFTIIPFIALCIARGIRKNKIKKTLKERMTT